MLCNLPKLTHLGRWFTYTHAGLVPQVVMADTCNDETVLNTVIEVYTSCNGGTCVVQR